MVFERLEDPDWDGRFPREQTAAKNEGEAEQEEQEDEDNEEGDGEDDQKRVNEDGGAAKRQKTDGPEAE